MTIKNSFAILGLMLLAQASAAQPTPMAVAMVEPLAVSGLPLEIGGVTAIAAVSLIIGAQLIKRRQK